MMCWGRWDSDIDDFVAKDIYPALVPSAMRTMARARISTTAEVVNLIVSLCLFVTFVTTLGVAIANADCCNGNSMLGVSMLSNDTRAGFSYASETVTHKLSDLDIDVDNYGPALRTACGLVKYETNTSLACPHKISGVTVTSIVMGILWVPTVAVGLYLRTERRKERRAHGRVQLYPDL